MNKNWRLYSDRLLKTDQNRSYKIANDLIEIYQTLSYEKMLAYLETNPVSPDTVVYLLKLAAKAELQKRAKEGGLGKKEKGPFIKIKENVLAFYQSEVVDQLTTGIVKYRFKEDFMKKALEKYEEQRNGKSVPTAKSISNWIDESGLETPAYWKNRKKK